MFHAGVIVLLLVWVEESRALGLGLGVPSFPGNFMGGFSRKSPSKKGRRSQVKLTPRSTTAETAWPTFKTCVKGVRMTQ